MVVVGDMRIAYDLDNSIHGLHGQTLGYKAMPQTGIALGDSTSNYNTTRDFYSQATRQGNSACNYKSDFAYGYKRRGMSTRTQKDKGRL